MNDENHRDHDVDGDAVEGSVVCVSREDVLQVLNENRNGPWPWEVGNQLMVELCQKVLDIFGMPAEWALSIVVYKGKGDIKNCSCYGVVKLLDHGMKVVERVSDKWLCRIVTVDEMQFIFMPVC